MSGSSVTVPGVSSGSTLTLSFVGSANMGLATQIANALAAASGGSTLFVTAYTGGAIPVAPGGTTVEELLLSPALSGSVSVPAGASGIADVLIVANTQPITIHGNANLSIVGGGPGPLDIIDPNLIAVGASIGAIGSAAVTVTAADSPYQVAMGPGFESVTGQGSGTIGGGVGTNYINVEAETGANLVNLVGSGDTVLAGSGAFTTSVNAAGYQGQVDGEGGPLVVKEQGYQDTISAGTATSAAVTTSGFRATVLGGTGTMSVLDTGLHNSIQAGTAATTVTLDGSSGRARGGDANLTADIMAAGNTIIGALSGLTAVTVAAAASGSAVFGRAGNTSILDLGANAIIGSGSGTGLVTVGGANTQVYGNATPGGTLNVSVGAADALVNNLGLSATVDGSSSLASGLLVFGGFSNTASLDGSLSVLGGSDQLIAVTGGSNATIDAAASAFTGIYIGTGSIAGDVLVKGSSGALQVNFIGGAGNATVLGGVGAATVFGTDGTDANFVGSMTGGVLYANGTAAGGETLSAANSTTNDTLFAASGNVSLVAGSGSDFMDAGANTGSLGGVGTVVGGDTMVAGSGADFINFTHGAFTGAAVVTNFTSADTVFLSGYNASAGGDQASIALKNATFTGGDTTIALADGTHITFVDTTVAQLTGHLSSR